MSTQYQSTFPRYPSHKTKLFIINIGQWWSSISFPRSHFKCLSLSFNVKYDWLSYETSTTIGEVEHFMYTRHIRNLCAQCPLEAESKASAPIRSLDYLLSLRMILCLRTWGFRYLLSGVFLPSFQPVLYFDPAKTSICSVSPWDKSSKWFLPLAWSTSFCFLSVPSLI